MLIEFRGGDARTKIEFPIYDRTIMQDQAGIAIAHGAKGASVQRLKSAWTYAILCLMMRAFCHREPASITTDSRRFNS
jgi:hypothetical protein